MSCITMHSTTQNPLQRHRPQAARNVHRNAQFGKELIRNHQIK